MYRRRLSPKLSKKDYHLINTNMRRDFIEWLGEHSNMLAENELQSAKLRTMQSYIPFIKQIPDLGNRMKAQQLNASGDFRGVLNILRAFNINPVSSTVVSKGAAPSIPSIPAPPAPRTPTGVNPFDPS